jgi:hypothetical protein
MEILTKVVRKRGLPWQALLLVLAPWLAALPALPVLAAEKERAKDPPKEPAKGHYLRLTRDENKAPVALETAITRFVSSQHAHGGVTVDLVAVVHVGEKSYYRDLNQRMTKYDAVLYELIAPEGVKVRPGAGGSGHPISILQRGMTDLLELEFQLDAIDYSRGNMVHADMSPEQLRQAMGKRGESMWTIMLRMMGYAMAKQGQDASGANDVQLLMALFDKNRALALKRIMAEQFQDMEGSLTALEGPKGSAIIADRNKVALDVLGRQIAKGKKRIAIFYGAGHMIDFEKHLHDDFHFAAARSEWLTAWNLRGAK